MHGFGRRVLAWSLFASLVLAGSTPAMAEEFRHRFTDTAADLRSSIEAGARVLRLDAGAVLREPGRPELPVRRVQVLVPEGSRVSAVRLESAAPVPLPGSNGLREAPAYRSSEGELAIAMAPRRAEAGWWPAEPVAVVADQVLHGYRIATIEIRPVRVDESGQAWMVEEPELVVEFGVDDAERQVVRRQRDLPAWEATVRERIRTRVLNPQDLARAGGPQPVSSPVVDRLQPGVAPSLTSSPVRHLILTTDELAAEFQRLADHRTAGGLPSAVVTLTELLANARQGVDLAETIREYVRDAYSWWGVDYLLIAADTELIPTRYVRSTFYPAGGFTDIPTDHYYACLDGDWNADGDGLFGEHFRNAVDTGDFADLEAELSVGRAPVGSVAEASLFVDKILDYEIPVTTDWQTSTLFAAEVLVPSDWASPSDPITIDGAALAETLIDSVMDPCADPSVAITRHYQNYTAYPGSVDESASGVFSALNSGNYGVFSHTGHGFYFTMSMGAGQFEVADADILQNAPNWFVLYSLNCSSSAYDFNCLNERFILNPGGGSVVSIGSSRAAFPTTASAFQESFYRAWHCDGLDRVGDAFLASREPFLGSTFYNTIERWTQFVYCLLGDPATRLWSATPVQSAFAPLPDMTLGDGQVAVTVNESGGSGSPLAGVTVTARKGLEDYAVGTTDGSGTVLLDFDPETTGEIVVWASGAGIVPINGTVTVLDGGAAVVSVGGTSLVDDGTSGSSGNGNGSAEAGEVIAFTPLFVNGGSVAALAGGTAILRSYDPLVTVADSVVSIPALAAESQDWAASSWTLSVSPDAPDAHATVLEVLLQPATGPARLDHVAFGLSAPEAEILALTFDDSAGDGDGIAESGETVDLVFTLKNYGEGAATGLTGTLSLVYGTAVISDWSGTWPDLVSALDTSDNSADRFTVLLQTVPDLITLRLSLTDAQGRAHVREFDLARPSPVENLVLAEGKPDRIRVSWDPSTADDFMGYQVYRKGPGDADFVLDSPDLLVTAATFEANDLLALSNYEFQVVTVDSAGLASVPSLPILTSTYPPEISCFPLRIGLETSGALAVGTVDSDFTPELIVGADYVYAIDGNCTEKQDGDGDSQTLGPINGLAGQYQPGGVALGDLYKDELGQEIVVVNRDTKQLYVLDDEGNPMPGWPQALLNWAWATPAIGDVDGDGEPEIVVTDITGFVYAFNHDGTEVADGDGNPGTYGVIAPRRQQTVGQTVYTESFGRTSPALFDVDGDGAREILFGSKYQNNAAPEFFYAINADGTGSNAPGWPKQFVPRSEFLASPVVADLENDGVYEIIAVSENDSLYVWDEGGNPRAGFPIARRQDSILQSSLTPSPAVADFDDDGTLEIVFVSVERLGSSTWVSRVEIVGADGSTWPGWPVEAPDLSESSPVIGDLDGDGSLDIAYGIGGTGAADDAIYAWDVNGQLLAGFPIPIEGFVRATPTIADFNRDGNVNLLSASWDSQIHVWDLLAPYDEDLVPWSTFRGNVNRTGVYQEFVKTAAPGLAPSRVTRLLPARPNPFNPATEIRFELGAASSDVSLVVYDARGRVVRELALAEDFDAGVHQVRWDGTDTRGRAVSSGIYFARMSVDGQMAGATKLALVK